MNAIDRIKAHLETTDIKDKLSTLKQEDYEEMMSHINDKAQKEAVDGVACIEDNDVFGWAYEWLMNYDPVKAEAKRQEAEKKKEKKAKAVKKHNKKVDEEMKKEEPKPSIFDKPVPKKKTVIEHEEDGTKAKQTNLFGW